MVAGRENCRHKHAFAGIGQLLFAERFRCQFKKKRVGRNGLIAYGKR
jgi:hypothetical protein